MVVYEIRNAERTTRGIINKDMIVIEAKIAAISRKGPIDVKDCIKLLFKSMILAFSTAEITLRA